MPPNGPAAHQAAGPSASPPPAPRAPLTRQTQKTADAAAVEGEALRRRQLLAALCHGSDRSWRDRYRAWPALIVGVLVAAVICAVIGVQGAFHKQQRLDREEQLRQERATRISTPPATPTQQATTPPTTPGATSTGAGNSVKPTHSRHHRVHPSHS